MHIILLVANLALVLAFSLLCLSLLRVRNLPAYLIGIYIVAYADIVLVLEAASLMTALSSPAVLRLQVLLTVAVSTLWLGVGRPPLLAPLSRLRFGGRPRDWRFAVKLISVVLVAGAVGYVYLRRAQWILAVVPNNYDSLTYHLSRVGYWLQYHSLYPWPTFNLRQTTFPMNAELGVLWTVLWTGTDRLSGFVQWISVPAVMLGTYGLTRLLGYSRWSSAVTALLWPTLTQVLFQSSTTQNDLVTAAFWIITVYYLVAANRGASTSYYALSGAAFGLAIGTKSTSLMVLPGFAVGILSMAFMNWRHPDFRRQFVRWTTACLLGFLLFGSYVYFQNAIAFGHFLGPRGLGVVQAEGGWRTNAIRLRDNLGRYAYQFVDFSPLPDPLAVEINPTKAAVFSRLFQWLRIPVENRETIATPPFDLMYINPLEEDTSWFGPLAVFLIPAVVAQAYQGLRRRDGLRLGLLIIGFGFVVVESALEAWTPYKGRYFMFSVAVLLPFLGCLIQTRTVWRALLTLCLVALGLVAMFAPTLNDPVLKNIGWGDAFSPSRMKIDWPKDFQYFMVAKNISTNGSIGLTGGGNFQDYPFFGENFTHYVTLAVPEASGYLPRADTQRFVTDFRQSDYLLLRSDNSASITAIPPDGFELLSYDRSLSTWIRSTLRSSDDCDADKWPFRDFYQSSQEAGVCPQFPITPPRTVPNSRVVYVEGDRYVPVISSRPNGFLKFNLLAKEATRLRLAIQVDPQGFTGSQTLQLLLSQNNTESQVYATQFRRKGLAQFVIALPKGTSTMQLELADSPLEVRIMSIQAVAP